MPKQISQETYYVAHERAMAPGIAGEWPEVIPHTTSKHGRLVKIKNPISQETARELLEACRKCNNVFASWQLGQIPGRPEDILALITEVRSAIAAAEHRL